MARFVTSRYPPAVIAFTVSRNRFLSQRRVTSGTEEIMQKASWNDVLPLDKGSHNSARIVVPPVPSNDGAAERLDAFDKRSFRSRLESTLAMCREMGKSSLWVEVPMSRASLVEDMAHVGLRFHHAEGETAVLNLWLRDGQSKIPLFATHNVGVGGLVVNSRGEILCVRELRRNYLPWKTPTGLADLGETIEDAAVREVYEETGIQTKFHSVVGFRQTHGLAHGRSDLFFVCRLDPVERVDPDGNVVIPDPVIQPCEIETAAWIPLDDYRAMVNGSEDNPAGHPMMRPVMAAFDAGRQIERRVVESVVPGRSPNSIFYPT
jgi:8-oxo-dGTP pyrophosphatase MutT (NUDIX family)